MTDLRALDALIAQHVYGKEVRTDDLGPMCRGNNVPWYSTPPYSTDIALAIQVLEKVAKRGSENRREQYHVNIGYRVLGEPGGKWWCNFERSVYRGEPDTFHADAETLPLAICLAALETLGMETP